MRRMLPLLACLAACPHGDAPRPIRSDEPVADVVPHDVVSPNGTRNDPYYWLRDDSRSDPKVLAYLEAENAYFAKQMASTAALQQELYDEIVGRIQEDDSTVPVYDRGYWYYTRYETGKQYGIACRKKGTLDAPEEILVDSNVLAEGQSFFRLIGPWISPDDRLAAWAEDTVGRNQYTLRVKDLTTGELLADRIEDVSADLAWANDSKTFFYVTKDEVSLRERAVRRHVLGAAVADDALVFDEPDGAYYVNLDGTKSRRYVQIYLWSTATNEVRLIDADAPTEAPRVFFPREHGHEYSIEHLGGRFWIHSNWQAKNFRLLEIADGKETDRAAWREVIPARDDVLLEDFAAYDGFLAVSERRDGLRRVRVLPGTGEPFEVTADDPTFVMHVLDTPDPASKVVRYYYTSLATPGSTFEVDVATGERTLLKREPVRGGFDPADYVTEYVHATARDGARVPISLVRKKTTPVDGTAPILINGYGSYGASFDPYFNSPAISLLDRGWVIAIAHVRGGEELGRAWYEDGRLLKKKNTFHDFIDATEHLVAAKYAARDQVFAVGRSAGGLLMGAIVHLRPDLYRGVIAGVPFVDVVTTMLDDTIPLTSNEFEEWGNPMEKAYYDYMLSYSPYDNVEAKAYPSILVTTGLWDSQVQYFEPAKWVAKLRANRTDQNLLIMHVDMDAGHGGKSGRYDRYREIARDHAFLLLVRDRPDGR